MPIPSVSYIRTPGLGSPRESRGPAHCTERCIEVQEKGMLSSMPFMKVRNYARWAFLTKTTAIALKLTSARTM